MKHFFKLILIGYSQLIFAVETCDYVDESNDVTEEATVFIEDMDDGARHINEEQRWMIDLDKHLMKHEDINVAMKALSSINESYGQLIDPNTQESILMLNDKLLVLNRMVNNLDANAETLLTAVNFCERIDQSEKCQIEHLKDQLFDLDADNIIIYFGDLSKAIKDNDKEMVDAIIERMSEAKFSHLPLSLTSEFIRAVDEYIDENPYPDVIDDLLVKDTGLDKSEIDQDLWKRQWTLMTYKMLTISNFPELRPLIVACTEYQNQPDDCLTIANTLINNSNSMLMTMIGYNLEEKVYQQFGDEKALTISQAAYEEQKAYSQCLMGNQIQVGSNDYLTDPSLLKIIIESNHEEKAFEQIADYLYKKYKKAGVENLADPKNCGLRHIQ
jgi:hypothetical protein